MGITKSLVELVTVIMNVFNLVSSVIMKRCCLTEISAKEIFIHVM